jgi:hypothetical protein
MFGEMNHERQWQAKAAKEELAGHATGSGPIASTIAAVRAARH